MKLLALILVAAAAAAQSPAHQPPGTIVVDDSEWVCDVEVEIKPPGAPPSSPQTGR
jgi:hypothetical protein